jgi:RsiW-degrading membrane proteinase PrsW (M82 family)
MLNLIVAGLGALLPTIFYISFIWWLDRYEKEPGWLLALAFLWGVIPAALASVIVEVIFDLSLAFLGGEGLFATLVSVSFGTPIIEEAAKGVALLGLALIFRREFDGVLDGIVYGAMIGFGFAFTENLFAYFLPILIEEGLDAGLQNIFLRTIVFGFNHAFWTATTGAAVGYARLSRKLAPRLLVPFGGWLLAVTLHALHNAGASLAEQTLCLSLFLSLGLHWGGLVLLLAVAALILRQESRWIRRGLVEEMRRGDLTPREFQLLSSASQRQRARWQAWRLGGRQAYRAVGSYYQCATELAFKKQHLRSLGDEGGNLEEIRRLRQALAGCRTLAHPWLWPEDA